MTKEGIRAAAVKEWLKRHSTDTPNTNYKDGFEDGLKWVIDRLAHTPWNNVYDVIATTYNNLKS